MLVFQNAYDNKICFWKIDPLQKHVIESWKDVADSERLGFFEGIKLQHNNYADVSLIDTSMCSNLKLA